MPNEDEQIARDLIAAIDAGNVSDAQKLLTTDVRIRLGNAEPTIGPASLSDMANVLAPVVASMAHSIVAIWAVDEPEHAVICELEVTYGRHDESHVIVPSVIVFRMRGGKIADYRAYLDLNPVFASHEA